MALERVPRGAQYLHETKRWYTELLRVEPYFTSEAAGLGLGLGPGYVEFRIGDYQHELGIGDLRFAPPGFNSSKDVGGVVAFWLVDDVRASLDGPLSMGASLLEPITERGPGFVTASVVDPFGNVLGIMFNRHDLDVLGSRGARPERERPTPNAGSPLITSSASPA